MAIRETYQTLYNEVLTKWEPLLEADLRKNLQGTKNIDRIVVRAKAVDSFVIKAEKVVNDVVKYSDPLNQIQDQIAGRIIVYYLSDVEKITEVVLNYYNAIQEQDIIPETEKEFGYFGKHFVLKVPTDVSRSTNKGPRFFELQIKTLFQHSWGEAEHDLMYKSKIQLNSEQRRKVAFTAAQAWGADHIFNELHKDLRNTGDAK